MCRNRRNSFRHFTMYIPEFGCPEAITMKEESEQVKTATPLTLKNLSIESACLSERTIGRIYKDHAFEALKLNFETQTSLLRFLTQIDLQVFIGYITLQLALASWLSSHPLNNWWIKVGVLLIDLVLSCICLMFLYNNYRRRKEVAETVRNLNEALGYMNKDVYLEGKTINAQMNFRPFWWWYLVGIGISTFSLFLIIIKGTA